MKNQKDTYRNIRLAMRRNEVELLEFIRRERCSISSLMGSAWHGALDRLTAAGMVVYNRKKLQYEAIKGACPVTYPPRQEKSHE